MPTSLRFMLILGLALVETTSLPAQHVGTIDQMDSLLATMTDGPGCTVGVVRAGKVIHRKSHGIADLEQRVPITPRSVFYTGSLSKQVTAMAVALLANDGMIDLDAPASRWLPEMTGPLAAITVRQMIHHTSGLREKWDLLAMQGIPTDRTVVTQQMVLDLVARQQELSFPPGTRHLYNNTGYDLLATLVARASGQSFRDFVTERIFVPRGMTRSLFGDQWDEVVPGRVMGYSRRDSSWMRSPALVETVGSGSLYSTLDDMLKWVAWFDTAPATDSALIRQLETPGMLTTGEPLEYGFGVVVDEWGGFRTIHHAGALAGYRTAIWRVPSLRWSAVALCNNGEARPDQMLQSLALRGISVLPRDRLGAVRIVEGGKPPLPDDLVGEYRSPELETVWVVTRQGEGKATGLVVRRPGAAEAALHSVMRDLIKFGDWEIRVERDSSGAITALLVDTERSLGVRFERQ